MAHVIEQTRQQFEEAGYTIVDEDLTKPWGAYFVIAEKNIQEFADEFFSERQADLQPQIDDGLKLTPKVLVVAPGQRLSWQYHHRRAELWKVIEGPVGVLLSDTDVEPAGVPSYAAGDVVSMGQGQRHRLVGLADWGVVAEILQHTDSKKPSDEEDIVRVADDYNRSS